MTTLKRLRQRLLVAVALLPLVLACSPAANQRVTDGLAVAGEVCRLLRGGRPALELAAKELGKPVDAYAAEACAAERVLDPLVRASQALAMRATAGAPPIADPWAAVAGSP